MSPLVLSLLTFLAVVLGLNGLLLVVLGVALLVAARLDL